MTGTASAQSGMQGRGGAPAADSVEQVDYGTTRWSSKRLFKVSYESSPSPVPLLAVHTWTVSIWDASGQPVSGARVLVEAGMPEHGHGFPTVPQVRSLGEGKYLLEGLRFHMPGRWVVGLRIKAGPVTDSVAFNLELG